MIIQLKYNFFFVYFLDIVEEALHYRGGKFYFNNCFCSSVFVLITREIAFGLFLMKTFYKSFLWFHVSHEGDAYIFFEDKYYHALQ